MNRLLITISLLVLTSCAGISAPQYRLEEILVVNKSRQPLRDVSIRAGGRVFGCGNIAPRGICSNRFAPRPYEARPIEIEWAHGAGAPRKQILEVAVPADFSTGIALRGVLEFDTAGTPAAYFLQADRSR